MSGALDTRLASVRMRVVHVTSSDSSLRYLLLDQLRYLQERGHDVAGISSDGPWVAEIQQAGIPVHTMPLTRRITPFEDLRALAGLTRLLRRLRLDLVHTHTPKAGLLGQWAALAAGVRHRVHTIHGLYFPGHMRPEDRWRYVWLERAQMAPAHALLSQNREDLDTCRRERICDMRKLRFLGNGIDVSAFHPRNARPDVALRLRGELGIPEGNQVVGMVGRLVPEKGYLEYFAAAVQVLQRRPNTTFLAIGSAETWKPGGASVTPETAAALGLGDRMRFLGHRTDVSALYGAMDVMILPSHREGFPRAPMEASATGIPVIATDVRGCREAVFDGQNGLLVPLRDPAPLADAIVRVLSDNDLRRRLGDCGRRIAEERFDQRIVFDRVAEAYDELDRERARGVRS